MPDKSVSVYLGPLVMGQSNKGLTIGTLGHAVSTLPQEGLETKDEPCCVSSPSGVPGNKGSVL